MSKIVVGYDGSDSANEALVWAAQAGQARGSAVEIVQAWHEPILDASSWAVVWADLEEAYQQAIAELADVAEAIGGEYPEVTFTSHVVGGTPAHVLLEAAEGADLVVVGARGRGGFAGLLLGSVGRKVAGHAPCTVVVIRGTSRPGGEIVVGIDGSESSRGALAWAAQEARQRGGLLRAVLAWSYLLPEGEHGPEAFRPDYTGEDAEKAAQAIVDDVLGADPGIDVKVEAPCELASKALLERSEQAALLVVGPRDESGKRKVDLGSVTVQVLNHAKVPVAIVR